MTKEEFTDQLLKTRKENADRAMTLVCQNVACTECPHYRSNYCSADIINDLLDYIIENESKAETNLEHYWDNLYVHFNVHQVEGYLACVESNMSIKEWLLQPYKESKAKYILTKFEYDLIKAHKNAYGDNTQMTWIYVDELKKLGYLKGVPKDAEVGEILDNAEVIDNG